MPVEAVLKDGALLFANRMAQPLIVASAVSAWRAVWELVPPPALVAGYSIGELLAYAIFSSIAVEEAVMHAS